jgi:hypothetical protein
MKGSFFFIALLILIFANDVKNFLPPPMKSETSLNFDFEEDEIKISNSVLKNTLRNNINAGTRRKYQIQEI